jgi:RNA polymerase sigma-70 factor (ECF subfamily)
VGSTRPQDTLSAAEIQRRRSAFSTLAAEHLPHVFRQALRMTRNPEDAEDLTQETFLRAYQSCHRLRRDTNLRAWLSRILLNTYINRYRRGKREPVTVNWDEIAWQAEAGGLDEPEQPAERPEEVVLSDVLDGTLQEALNALPDQFRDVLLKASVGDLSYDEIAGEMDIPIGTVRSRLFRARRLLRRRLGSYAVQRRLA